MLAEQLPHRCEVRSLEQLHERGSAGFAHRHLGTIAWPLALTVAVLLAMDLAGFWRMLVSLLVGTPALAAFGTIGASVTVAIRRGGLIAPILIAPLCVPVLTKLRKAGINSEIFPENAKMKKQMNYANKKEIPFVVLAGESEMAEQKFTLKNMHSGEQNLVTAEELIKIVLRS